MNMSETNIKQKISKNFRCIKCNKLYSTASVLWKHHNICIIGELELFKPICDSDDTIMRAIKETNDVKWL